MVIALYLIGALASWFALFQFMKWFSRIEWPILYKYDAEGQDRSDLILTGIFSIVWPVTIIVLPTFSLIWHWVHKKV